MKQLQVSIEMTLFFLKKRQNRKEKGTKPVRSQLSFLDIQNSSEKISRKVENNNAQIFFWCPNLQLTLEKAFYLPQLCKIEESSGKIWPKALLLYLTEEIQGAWFGGGQWYELAFSGLVFTWVLSLKMLGPRVKYCLVLLVANMEKTKTPEDNSSSFSRMPGSGFHGCPSLQRDTAGGNRSRRNPEMEARSFLFNCDSGNNSHGMCHRKGNMDWVSSLKHSLLDLSISEELLAESRRVTQIWRWAKVTGSGSRAMGQCWWAGHAGYRLSQH